MGRVGIVGAPLATTLGVELSNEGTRRLRVRYAHAPAAKRGLRKAHEKARDPVRCAKIAAAKRGKPRPRHVIEAMRAGRLGKPQSAETRRKMSESHKRRGTIPPAAEGKLWTAAEDALVRLLPVTEVMRRTRRTKTAVYVRRRVLELPDGRMKRSV